MANYFDNIRKLNNLQLCYFMEQMNANLELCALALTRAQNPEIYCSEDDFCIGTPNEHKEWYKDAVYWHRCLRKDYDELMDDLKKSEYSRYVQEKPIWITTDQKPDDKQSCILSLYDRLTGKNEIGIGVWFEDEGWVVEHSDEGDYIVMAWKPFPEPWKKDKGTGDGTK